MTFLEALLGALLGGGSFFLTGWVYERFTGRAGMGEGDVKLMVMIGAILGADPALHCLRERPPEHPGRTGAGSGRRRARR